MPHSSSLPFQPHWSFISWKTTSPWPPWGLCNGHLRLAVTSLFLQRAAAASLWCVLKATSSESFLVTWSTHSSRPPHIQRPIIHFLVDLTISTILSLQILFTSNKMQGTGNLIWIVLCLAYSGCSTNTLSVNKVNSCQALCYEWVLEIRQSDCPQTVQVLMGK